MMGTLSREVQLELRCEHLEEIELPLPPSYQEAMSQTIFTIDDFCASRDTQNASTLSNENARDMQAATTDHEGQNSSLAVEVETSGKPVRVGTSNSSLNNSILQNFQLSCKSQNVRDC
ncbi:uncharacterized protein LOC135685366 isoform X4 [Rhopilema esculentum]|uniref:uncharacterized protein LOC135685366 isoform X4 n=1 Tax=Rhopilema esculentum TaxID=499914 RepID=UPI0031D61CCB